MKTVIVAIICLAACAFAIYEAIRFIQDIKNRKKKKEDPKEKQK